MIRGNKLDNKTVRLHFRNRKREKDNHLWATELISYKHGEFAYWLITWTNRRKLNYPYEHASFHNRATVRYDSMKGKWDKP